MITTYAELKPLIAVRLPRGVESGVLDNEIQLAAQQFCEDSERWELELNDIDVVAGQQEYDLSHVPAVVGPPAVAASGITNNTEIIRILWVKINGAIQPVEHYWLHESAVLRWHDNYIPTAAVTDGLDVKVVLKPDLATDALPSWFLTRWRLALVYKTLVNICLSPGKPYYDANAAAVFDQAYNERLALAKFERYDQGRSQEVRVACNPYL